MEKGIDFLIVRELLGDIYFGEHKTVEEGGKKKAIDVCEYTEDQIASIAHVAFKAAQKRDKRLISVDKVNVLDTSKLWREVVARVHQDYPDVSYEDMLVDNCAMQIVKESLTV